jgi:copper resistance protein B
MTRSSIVRIISIAGLMLATSSLAFAQVDPHAGHQQSTQTPPAKPSSVPTHDHSTSRDAKQELPPFVPRLTDQDRQAAFPDVQGHTVHDNAVNYFVLFDQMEWQAGEGKNGLNLDTKGWIGRDRDRLWFRAEGEGEDGSVHEAQTHLMYGRQFSRWWDVVAGIRQDLRPGPAQTWAAVGVQGLAPYWFEVEATAYVGSSGRTHARFEVEYELLLTNRLILQPLVEAEIFGKPDPERGIGAGLSTTDVGLRIRYEVRRELAPYIGVTWSRKWGETAEFAEAAGEDSAGARFVTGLRLWF